MTCVVRGITKKTHASITKIKTPLVIATRGVSFYKALAPIDLKLNFVILDARIGRPPEKHLVNVLRATSRLPLTRTHRKMRKLTTEQFIERAKLTHGDRYDYSMVEYVNARNKVKIICSEHGEFKQLPNDHLSGKGCPSCGGKLKLTTGQFIERAKLIHGNRYDYSTVEYVNNNTKVNIICSEHGEFKQVPNNHLNGQSCRHCGRVNRLKTISGNTSSFIRKAVVTHGDRYDYSMVEYVNAKNKVKIICSEHGEFKQLPNGHLSGNGCPSCAGVLTLTTDQFIERAKLIHGDRYDYSMVEYVNVRNKVNISCSEHGQFKQTPNSHLRGSGCGLCSINGFDTSKEGKLYILISNDSTVIKIGITGCFERRLVELKCRTPFEFNVIELFDIEGHIARTVEKALHDVSCNAGLRGFDGATEWFIYSHETISLARCIFSD